MLKPKVGDLVRLKPFTILSFNENQGEMVYLDRDSRKEGRWENVSGIEEILPRPLVVGDRVQVRDQFDKDIFAVVIGIDEDAAWLRWSTGGYGHTGGTRNSHRLVDLVRIDEP